ncbi:MAG: hypothetical protein R3300_05285, partial [Candidatus Promineifilaceae bacterium]|nr:hypothetical protein [Candidatus Promineifilaceae bacterium]
MSANWRSWLLPLTVLLLAACAESRGSDPRPTAAPTSESDAEQVEAAATQTATSTPAPSPTPTALRPLVMVNDQEVDEEGLITVERVVAPEAAWLVIHADSEGQPGTILNATAVGPGEEQAVTVTVDLAEITPLLHAVLHQDAGQPGEFDFPGPDEALSGASDAASASFEIELVGLMPSLNVSDQEIGSDGVVTVTSVTAPAPGWVVLHADEEGRPGTILNFAPVRRGENRRIAIPIDWREATPRLFAMLHEDTGRPERFDFPEADPPLA